MKVDGLGEICMLALQTIDSVIFLCYSQKYIYFFLKIFQFQNCLVHRLIIYIINY